MEKLLRWHLSLFGGKCDKALFKYHEEENTNKNIILWVIIGQLLF